MSELKKCPLCGGEGVSSSEDNYVTCPECFYSILWLTQEKWNTRQPIEDIIEELNNGDRAVFTRGEIVKLLRDKK